MGEWKLFGNVGVYVFQAAVVFTVLHPAMLIAVSQSLIMQASVPKMPFISLRVTGLHNSRGYH